MAETQKIYLGDGLALNAYIGGSEYVINFQRSILPETQNFLNATGITDDTIKGAINGLVANLKAANIWDSIDALYPLVGGTADTHKWNLKDTGSFQITWNGTITHNVSGSQGDGSTGWADTNLNASSSLAGGQPNFGNHMVLYMQSITGDSGLDAGVTGTYPWRLNSRNPSDVFNTQNMDTSFDSQSNSTGSAGFYAMSRTGTTAYFKSINKTHTSVLSSNAQTMPDVDIAFMAQNSSGGAGEFQDRMFSLVSFGDALSQSEMSDFVDANETFQTALGRFA